jgi:tRNA-splicing ligase RtcB (3'-phosphate/5'-hydroxy nucleic acid ligase)
MGIILDVRGQHDANTLAQIEQVAQRAEYAALMADSHKGYIMPIGGVAAYENAASVVGVGFDIACGNCAIKTDLRMEQLSRQMLGQIADEIAATISFGVGRSNKADDAPVDHPLFESAAWELLPKSANRHNLQGKARSQLGTVGSGNHYVDVFADESGTIWVGVHFGSRGLGHTIASGFLSLGQGKEWGERVPEAEVILDLSTPMGHDYWHLMELAGEYAYAGREWVTRKVVSILGGREVAMVHNHHNYSWREEHFGRELIVVRKGATPAFPGQLGFVGGSMGDLSVILRGKESEESANTLYSTVHGAGRVMSRTEAKGKYKGRGKNATLVRPGRVTQEMMDAWLTDFGVIRRGGDLDESPHAYRRLPDVLAAQGDTIEIEHMLRPLIAVMAGSDIYDPFKD